MFGVQETGACVVGMPSKDTVKVADEADFVSERQTERESGQFRLLRYFLMI